MKKQPVPGRYTSASRVLSHREAPCPSPSGTWRSSWPGCRGGSPTRCDSGNSIWRRPEALRLFDTNVQSARTAIAASSDAEFDVPWSLKHGTQVLFTAPRRVVVRQHINYLVHHRGQLSVYLRLLDVPVPSIYGPTADERPW